jgi:two-component system, LytTR family, sensor kinase
MMQHPILKNSRSLFIYLSIWGLLAIVFFIISYSYKCLSIEASIFNSIYFNAYFALIGIAIWYAVLYSYPEKIGFINIIINHIASASVLIFILAASTLYLNKILFTESDYSFSEAHILLYVITGVVYYITFVLAYYLQIYNHNLKERKKNEDRLLGMVKEAELNLLKSQINPHFLFNSLNSISSLTITNPAKAQEMIIKLSDFLRYSISRSSNQMSTLKLELENLERYLDIEKIRFGSRLDYKPEVSEKCLSASLPVMILQPIFENAIKHGVYESTEPITLSVTAVIDSGFLVITVKNNFDPEAPSKKGTGTGLRNISDRLKLIYLSDGLIKVTRGENTFEVIITIPQYNLKI